MSNSTINYICGYVKFNTRYIPNIISKNKHEKNQQLNGNIYIKSEIPIELKIGGVNYILNEGEHFIPSVIHACHYIELITEISNNDIEIYIDCLVDEQYLNMLYVISSYFFCVDSINVKNANHDIDYADCSNLKTIFAYGMCNALSVEKINQCEYGINLNLHNVIENHDMKKYSCFIYSCEIESVKNDKEITDLLINYDKNIVRQSYPPCIGICYEETNYEKLKNILISKYNIEIKLPNKADSIYGKKTYDEILHIINKHNQKMTECLKIEAFEFVITKEIPFTIDYYNSLFVNDDINNY